MSVLTVDKSVSVPVELVTEVLKHWARFFTGREPTRIVHLLCTVGSAHRRALEAVLYDIVILRSSRRLQQFHRLVSDRAGCSRRITVRALSLSAHDGTVFHENLFLDLLRLLAPNLAMLQAGPGYTALAISNADVSDLYLDEYAGGWFMPLLVPTRSRPLVRRLWLGPFPENMERFSQMVSRMPNLRCLGLVFKPCNPVAACRILGASASHGIEQLIMVVQEWTLEGTLLSCQRLEDSLKNYVEEHSNTTAYRVIAADPARWRFGPYSSNDLPSLWLGNALGEFDYASSSAS